MLKNHPWNRRPASFLWLVAALAACWFLGASGTAADEPSSAEEKTLCAAKMRGIFRAVQTYQRVRQELPDWLSDLVPDYLPDIAALSCPASHRSAEAETSTPANARVSYSYFYELILPLGEKAPLGPSRAYREWKLKQAALAGTKVPLVRCSLHGPAVLNLSFDGRVFESGASWDSPPPTNLVAAVQPPPGKTSPPSDAKPDAEQHPPHTETAPAHPATAETHPEPAPPSHGAPDEPTQSSSNSLPAASASPSKATGFPVPLPATAVALLCFLLVVFLMRDRPPKAANEAAPDAAQNDPIPSDPAAAADPSATAPVIASAEAALATAPEAVNASELSATPVPSPEQQAAAPENATADAPSAELNAQVSEWLKEGLVQQLAEDRSALMESQQAAITGTDAATERLARIEAQWQEQQREQEQRIQALTAELHAAREENHALIQAKIDLVKAEMETAQALHATTPEVEPPPAPSGQTPEANPLTAAPPA